MQPTTPQHLSPAAPASSLRILSSQQVNSIANGALVRLTRCTAPRVLILERGGRYYALHLNLVQVIEPRQWNSDRLLNHIPDLKLPSPLAPLTAASRDIVVDLSGLRARLGADRLVSTHNLNVAALADPQELIPSGWLLGYFDHQGTTVALIDPAALLPVRHSAPFAA